MTDAIVLPADELKNALVKAGCSDELASDTAAHYDEMETQLITAEQEVERALSARNKAIADNAPSDPECLCPKCKAIPVKTFIVEVHAPLTTTSFTKSSLRFPGVDIPKIHWDKATLVCRSCGWNNAPSPPGFWKRLFG